MVAMGWITWFLHGILQSILLWAPLVDPLQEEPIPNPWWEPCEIFDLWAYLLDENQRPTAEFMDLYWECLWAKFRGGIVDQYNAAISARVIPIWDTIGSLPEMVSSVVEWIALIWAMIGENLPDWAYDVMSGLSHLWELLPGAIRDGLQTWAEFIDGAGGALQEWVETYIGWAIDWVNELWEWYTVLAQFVTNWWQQAHSQLDDLLSDAYGWIARILGETWDFLVWFWSDPYAVITKLLSPFWGPLTLFAADCLDYWYNLWGSYSKILAAFLEDPLAYLWLEGEAWLNDRLERP